MGAIDTHTHVQFEQFDADRDAVIASCWEAGLEALIVVGTDIESSQKAIDLCVSDDRLHPTAGIHPHDASTYDEAAAAELRKLAASGEIVAIGEIGLDFYRNLSPRDAQLDAFLRQLDLAAQFDLPVIVHTRASIEEAYTILADWSPTLARSTFLGVMHCFSGSLDQALGFVEMGFLVSIPATISYPRNDVQRTVAQELPLESLVVETDSPYLPPQQIRGQRNDPTRVLDAIEVVAQVRGQPQDEIVKVTSDNARRLFRL